MKFEDLLATTIEVPEEGLGQCLAEAAEKFPSAQVFGSTQVSCGQANLWLHRLSEADCWFEQEDIEALTLALGERPRFFIQIQFNSATNASELAREVERALSKAYRAVFQFFDGRIGTLERL
jgi:hypothetical protein